MSILLTGKLTVKKISGKHGDFCVGELVTEIGMFKVKDALLDQFDPGQYDGKFLIASIFLHSYIWRGTVNAEIHAKLAEIYLEADEVTEPLQETAEVIPSEPDPIEDKVLNQPKSVVSEVTEEEPATEVKEQTPISSDDDMTLFGEEIYRYIKASLPVKLDSTVDRARLRTQRDRLELLGYEFKAKTQTWQKKPV